jgi:MoxR-like ATPase
METEARFRYVGRPQASYPTQPLKVAPPLRASLDDAAGYVADKGLVDAVNVALTLGQPLLLTGEAGTGKTQLAYSLAKELGMSQPLKFETKSSSSSRDLFYTFDVVRRFHAAHSNGSTDNRDYITYSALGLAILLACPPAKVSRYLPEHFKHTEPRQHVVLVDEVDKAPRDFPNDILNEIEGLYFRIPELGNEVIRPDDASLRPILIFTSNSEKHLPEPFLRRCIFYNISFPQRAALKEIIAHRVGSLVGLDRRKETRGEKGEHAEPPLLRDALDFFELMRSPAAGLRKKPATAEFLGWLIMLNKLGVTAQTSLRANRKAVEESLCTLVKTTEDQTQALALLNTWK